MTEKKSGYVAPPRKEIKKEVVKLLSKLAPPVDPKLVQQLDWWALYTIHQDVVKSGRNPAALAEQLIKGYNPQKIKAQQAKEAARKARAEEKIRLAGEKEEARRRTAKAKEQARVAKEKARAAQLEARAKEVAARATASAAKAAPVKPAVKAAASGSKTATASAAKPSARIPASAYVAPVRKYIKDELAKLMPMIKRSDLTGLDYWALYTMHADIVKYGRDPESLARKFVKGYKKKKK